MPAAPEVLQRPRGYDAKQADVWSSGVMLFAMLSCAYPFERPEDERDPRGHHRVVQRIINGARGTVACLSILACVLGCMGAWVRQVRAGAPSVTPTAHARGHACICALPASSASTSDEFLKVTCKRCCWVHAQPAG